MLGICVLEDTFRAEHLRIILTEELNLFILVCVAVGEGRFPLLRASLSGSSVGGLHG